MFGLHILTMDGQDAILKSGQRKLQYREAIRQSKGNIEESASLSVNLCRVWLLFRICHTHDCNKTYDIINMSEKEVYG